jgi:hypothetical protein
MGSQADGTILITQETMTRTVVMEKPRRQNHFPAIMNDFNANNALTDAHFCFDSRC